MYHKPFVADSRQVELQARASSLETLVVFDFWRGVGPAHLSLASIKQALLFTAVLLCRFHAIRGPQQRYIRLVRGGCARCFQFSLDFTKSAAVCFSLKHVMILLLFLWYMPHVLSWSRSAYSASDLDYNTAQPLNDGDPNPRTLVRARAYVARWWRSACSKLCSAGKQSRSKLRSTGHQFTFKFLHQLQFQ